MNKFNYEPVTPDIIEQLKAYCGEDAVIYNDEKKLGRALDRQAKLIDIFTELGGPGYEGHVR